MLALDTPLVEAPGAAPSRPARPTLAPAGTRAPLPTLPIGPTANSSNDGPALPAEKFVALAAKDLAKRLGVPGDQITTVDATAITWPDAALGCPLPGKAYPRGRVPGYKLILAAQGQQYNYHTDQTGRIVYCPEAMPALSDPELQPAPGSEKGPATTGPLP